MFFFIVYSMKRLNKLIKCKYDTPIYGVKTNSKEVEKGDLFIAVHGFNVDHHDYIIDAIERGAVAIISEKKVETLIPVVIVKNTNKTAKKILKKFYENIEKDFSFIGVTGTDGKTTTSTIISYILQDVYNCCNIGTNGLIYKDYKETLDNTTPSCEKMYNYLLELNKNGCKYVSMEVSSESLLHKRLDMIKYNVGIMTNITEDHLNIHKTLDNYIESKGQLFEQIKKDGFSILNIDDKYYDRIKKRCHSKVFTYGKNVKSDFRISKIKCQNMSTIFNILHKNRVFTVNTKLMGVYNVYNITAAFACCYLMGVNCDYILERIREVEQVSGRGEYLDFGQKFKIVLDYAHTSNAIENVLSALSVDKIGRIITVTGSAGGREKEKRVKMGEIVSLYSDVVIFTTDDPRYEDPLNIIHDLAKNITKNNYQIILDRKDAIHKALSMANKDDIVVILGKGRDDYMAVLDKKIGYSDYESISSYFIN